MHSRLHKWCNGRIKPVARPRIPQRERSAECLLELLATRSQLCHPAAANPPSCVSRATIRKRSCNERATSYSFLSLFLIFFPSKSTGCGAHPNFPDRYCAPRYESARSPRGNRVSRDGLEFFRERERESRVERAYGEYSRGEYSNRLVCELGGCGL